MLIGGTFRRLVKLILLVYKSDMKKGVKTMKGLTFRMFILRRLVFKCYEFRSKYNVNILLNIQFFLQGKLPCFLTCRLLIIPSQPTSNPILLNTERLCRLLSEPHQTFNFNELLIIITRYYSQI